MAIVVYHNPDCGISRNVLRIISASGDEPTVIEYLETGWTRPRWPGLFAAANLSPRAALRTSKSPAERPDLLDRQPAGPFCKDDGERVVDEEGRRVV